MAFIRYILKRMTTGLIFKVWSQNSHTSGNQVGNEVNDHGGNNSTEVSNEANMLISSLIKLFNGNSLDMNIYGRGTLGIEAGN